MALFSNQYGRGPAVDSYLYKYFKIMEKTAGSTSYLTINKFLPSSQEEITADFKANGDKHVLYCQCKHSVEYGYELEFVYGSGVKGPPIGVK